MPLLFKLIQVSAGINAMGAKTNPTRLNHAVGFRTGDAQRLSFSLPSREGSLRGWELRPPNGAAKFRSTDNRYHLLQPRAGTADSSG